jgi:hypothetical protein
MRIESCGHVSCCDESKNKQAAKHRLEPPWRLDEASGTMPALLSPLPAWPRHP